MSLDPDNPLRSTDENYDGEFSAYLGRSDGGAGDFFADVVERRATRRGAIKAGLILTAAVAAGAATAAPAADAEATQLASVTGAAAPHKRARPPLA